MKQVALCHTARKWQAWDGNPGSQPPEHRLLITLLCPLAMSDFLEAVFSLVRELPVISASQGANEMVCVKALDKLQRVLKMLVVTGNYYNLQVRIQARSLCLKLPSLSVSLQLWLGGCWTGMGRGFH